MAIKGQNLRVFLGSGSGAKCIAAATNCTLSISSQSEDASTKDVADDWSRIEIVGKSWEVTTESLVVLTDPESASGKTTVDIIGMIGQEVDIKFDQTAGTNNRTGQNSTIKKTGKAYITSLNVTAANRANSTLSVTFTGNGALS